MILYDKKDNSLDIYEFKAWDKDLTDYRREQIEKIPENERVFFVIEPVDPYGRKPILEAYTRKPFNDEVLYARYEGNEERHYRSIYGQYHILISDGRDKRNNKSLLDCYCLGFLADKNVVPVKYSSLMKYYLIKQEKYKGYILVHKYIMENIIQLPESLYILQLLEQGRFAPLEGKDISEQLALYTLGKINEISLEELQKMDSCGITQNIYEKTLEQAENDAHVLKLIRKCK